MLAARFDRKAAMRETWLSENQRLVSQVVKENGISSTLNVMDGCVSRIPFFFFVLNTFNCVTLII